jgi:hypothetical protein
MTLDSTGGGACSVGSCPLAILILLKGNRVLLPVLCRMPVIGDSSDLCGYARLVGGAYLPPWFHRYLLVKSKATQGRSVPRRRQHSYSMARAVIKRSCRKIGQGSEK